MEVHYSFIHYKGFSGDFEKIYMGLNLGHSGLFMAYFKPYNTLKPTISETEHKVKIEVVVGPCYQTMCEGFDASYV